MELAHAGDVEDGEKVDWWTATGVLDGRIDRPWDFSTRSCLNI